MRQNKNILSSKEVETTREIFNLQLNNLSSAVSLLFPHSLLNYNGMKKNMQLVKNGIPNMKCPHKRNNSREEIQTDPSNDYRRLSQTPSYMIAVVVVDCIIIAFTLNYVHIYLIFDA